MSCESQDGRIPLFPHPLFQRDLSRSLTGGTLSRREGLSAGQTRASREGLRRDRSAHASENSGSPIGHLDAEHLSRAVGSPDAERLSPKAARPSRRGAPIARVGIHRTFTRLRRPLPAVGEVKIFTRLRRARQFWPGDSPSRCAASLPHRSTLDAERLAQPGKDADASL